MAGTLKKHKNVFDCISNYISKKLLKIRLKELGIQMLLKLRLNLKIQKS